MFVREIMSPNVEWVAPDLPLREAARKMRDIRIGCLPVKDKGDSKPMGMITDRDIACRAVAEGLDPAKTLVREIMTMGATYCFDDQDVSEAAHLMEDKKLHRLPVMSRDMKMVGLLSLSDLATKSTRDLSGAVLEKVSAYAH